MTPLLPSIIVPGFIPSVSVENWTCARGLLEPNWAQRLLETLRSKFLVSSVKLRRTRSHMSSALLSVLRFEVYVCTARERSRGERFRHQTGFRVPRGWGVEGVGAKRFGELCVTLKKILATPLTIFTFSNF